MKLFLQLVLVFISGLHALKCESKNFQFYNRQSPDCLPCDKCIAGEGRDPTETVDRSPKFGALNCPICRPCRDGFFNDKEALICQPCKKCDERNVFEIKPCMPTSNSKCSKRPPRTTNMSLATSPPVLTKVKDLVDPFAAAEKSPKKEFQENGMVSKSGNLLLTIVLVAFFLIVGIAVLMVAIVLKRNNEIGYSAVNLQPTPKKNMPISTSRENEQASLPCVVDCNNHQTDSFQMIDEEQVPIKQIIENKKTENSMTAAAKNDIIADIDTGITQNTNTHCKYDDQRNEHRFAYEKDVDTDGYDSDYQTQDLQLDAVPLLQSYHRPIKRHRSYPIYGKPDDQMSLFHHTEKTVNSVPETQPPKTNELQSLGNCQRALDDDGKPFVSELSFISKMLVGKPGYEDFARGQGIQECELDCIKCNNVYPKERAFQVLSTWIQLKGKKATRKNLNKALQDIGRNDIVHSLSSHSFNPDLDT